MEWDSGAFMRIAIGVFFLVFGAGLGFALYRLAVVLGQLHSLLRDANQEVLPLLTRLETTLDGVNSELGKVDEITGSLVGLTHNVERGASAVQGAVSTPIKKVAGFAAGVSEAVSAFFSHGKEVQ